MLQKQKMREAYDGFTPDAVSRRRMLNRILTEAEQPRRRKMWFRPLASAAAMFGVVVLLGSAAYANGWFGLSSVRIGETTLEYAMAEAAAEDMAQAPEAQTAYAARKVEIISLQGMEDSPEYQAAAEWFAFTESYDTDKSKLAEVGNGPTGLDSCYEPYLCYTQEMADKLDAIRAKYGLELLRDFCIYDSWQQLETDLGIQGFAACSDPGARNTLYTPYGYGDGTFHADGELMLAPERWAAPVSYQVERHCKGSFSDTFLNIGRELDYVQWEYETSGGVTVLLALSDSKGLIFADFPEAFVSVNVLDTYYGDEQLGEVHMTQETMEAVAECFQFQLLQ